MKSANENLITEYDQAYHQPHFFHHKASVQRPFIRSLVNRANLSRPASVLDVGCGQGFFTWLFADLGFQAVGVDISPQGIQSAQDTYGSCGAKFEVGDVVALPYDHAFDCVFARCFSLYNSEDFEADRRITDAFLRYVKPGGVFIFVYSTSLARRKRRPSWIYHSLQSVRNHFNMYATSRVYFSFLHETRCLGSLAFSRPVTIADSLVSRATGKGGCAVAFVWKSQRFS